MKESLSKLDKNLIFRETFQDEQSVRANGGVPTNVTFKNGIGVFNGSNTKILSAINVTLPTSAIRIKFKLKTVKNCSIYDTLKSGQSGYYHHLYIFSGKIADNWGLSSYINGVSYSWNTFSVEANKTYEIVTNITYPISYSVLTIGCLYNSSSFSDIDIELFEIYQGTLTAQEVQNLYQNRRYKKLTPHGEIIGIEQVVNGTFNVDSDWTKTGNCTIANGVATINGGYIYQEKLLSAGKQYKITAVVSNYSAGAGTKNIAYRGIGGGSSTETSIPVTGNGTYSTIFTASGNVSRGFFCENFASGSYNLDNFSVVEYSKAELILDVDAFDGVIKNRLSGTKITNNLVPTVVNTAVQVVNDGGLNVMRFNNSTSKLDCGNYHNLLGDITICAWFKLFGWGENIATGTKASILLTNGNLWIIIDNGQWYVTNGISVRENGTDPFAWSNTNALTLGRWYNLAITRKSDGKTTIFINSVISRSADQAGGTLTIGTTNIIIGNFNIQNYTMDGNIAQVQVYSGILSQAEISQKFTSERSKYNV